MKRFIKTLGVIGVAAFALTAMTAASASAAQFTASETGTLSGTQTSDQVFTVTSGGSAVTCKKASTSGTITETEAASQHVTVEYSECTVNIFGTQHVTISPATYELYANGNVDIENEITISVPSFGCSITVGPQSVESVSYTNSSGKIEQHSAVTGIVSSSTGLCPSGTTGTYSGSNLVERVGGGTLAWHS